MKNYKTIHPPFSLNFKEMSKSELKDYYQWYQDQIPLRLEILKSGIKSTNGYKNFPFDFTPESLIPLGQWFYENVETRKKSEDEIRTIYDNAPDWFKTIEINDWQLTNKTFSLAIDIGMYLANVFIKNNSNITWHHYLVKRKNDANYGQPVLKGFGNDFFNPTWICITLAYGLAKKTKDGNRLKQIYDTWLKYIK